MTPLGEGTYHILAVVENLGFLPTHVAEQALKMKAVQPVRLELALPEGATLIGGKIKQEIGQLQGRSNKMEVAYDGVSPTDNRGKAEWVVAAPKGATLKLSAISERGGVLHRDVILGS